jgi:5-methylcytosine-specific restriction endonuclease McrA
MSFTCCDCGVAIFKNGNGRLGRNPKRCRPCRLVFRAASGRGKRPPARHMLKCKQCKKSFKSCRDVQQFCSRLCMHLGQRSRLSVQCCNPACNKECQACPSKLAKGNVYCSKECAQSRYPPPLMCQNPTCGRSFRMKNATKNKWRNAGKYCCPKCYQDHRYGQDRPRRVSSVAAIRSASCCALGKSLRKRCKLFGVTFDPACTRQAVIERDRSVCQKCHVLCNKEYVFVKGTRTPCDRNAEHDHIIPLSKPGSPGNVFENSQCLCRRCNRIKWDTAEGQLRLPIEEEAWGRGVRVRSQQSSSSFEETQATGPSTRPSRSQRQMAL